VNAGAFRFACSNGSTPVAPHRQTRAHPQQCIKHAACSVASLKCLHIDRHIESALFRAARHLQARRRVALRAPGSSRVGDAVIVSTCTAIYAPASPLLGERLNLRPTFSALICRQAAPGAAMAVCKRAASLGPMPACPIDLRGGEQPA